MTIRKFVSLTVSVLFFAVACSRQGQGERCAADNANLSNDCEDGLVCQGPLGAVIPCDPNPNSQYKNQQNDCAPWRCCPPAGVAYSDNRCFGYGTPPPVTGTGGSDAGTDTNTGGSQSTGGTSSTSGT